MSEIRRVGLDLSDGDTSKRFTVTHPGIAGQPPMVSVARSPVADEDDPGWVYVANVLSVAADSFDVNIVALMLGEVEINDEYPNETISLVYAV